MAKKKAKKKVIDAPLLSIQYPSVMVKRLRLHMTALAMVIFVVFIIVKIYHRNVENRQLAKSGKLTKPLDITC